MHVPIYNSNEAHYMEGESMRAVFESWFVHYKVDVVFAGHVHAYERSVMLLYHFTRSWYLILQIDVVIFKHLTSLFTIDCDWLDPVIMFLFLFISV